MKLAAESHRIKQRAHCLGELPEVVGHAQQISRSFGTQFNGKKDELLVRT